MNLGDKAKDKLTGFTGTIVGKTEWLFGCIRFGVQSGELHDGKPIDLQWFDEHQLVEVGHLPSPAPPDSDRMVRGGPQADPTRSSGSP